jgi:lipopolysaccharide transport system ATP-binding protein
MSDIAIKVEGLSKQYRIGERESYKALRDVISDAASAPFRRLRSAFGNGSATNGNGHEIRNSQSEIRNSFWALDDVSFEVKRGEVVGIIGRNGAGKSTLLKILSRITRPTTGHATIHGRVGSLLEVGTGFHPELTGRENIYLNAAILGMRKAEVARRFDEIVAFAEVDKFIDTPVKRYSSGMYVRLAFAVAAHMDTEILLVDEVLAVGDREFQKKCLGKMGEVSMTGRTVCFVSHNMGAVQALCGTAIWLDQGRVKHQGDCREVSVKYLNASDRSDGAEYVALDRHIKGSGKTEIETVSLRDMDKVTKNSFLVGEPFEITLGYRVKEPVDGTFWILLCSVEGTVLVSSFQKDVSGPVTLTSDGEMLVVVDSVNLLPGFYTVSAGIFSSSNDVVDWIESVSKFEVLPHFVDGRPFDHRYGFITQEFSWRIQRAC